jgi:hypothetical protein
MRRIILFLVLLTPGAVRAQISVGPPVSELGVNKKGEARAELNVANVSLIPQFVVIEARGFLLDADGKTVFRPLESTTTVELSETSARVGAKQSRQFDAKITCTKLPCWVSLVGSAIVGKSTNGAAEKVNIFTTWYVCEKAKNCRDEIRQGVFHLAK